MQNEFQAMLDNLNAVFQDTQQDIGLKNTQIQERFQLVEDFVSNEERKTIIKYSKDLWNQYVEYKEYYTWYQEDMKIKR